MNVFDTGFDTPRWRRDALKVLGLTITGYGIGVVVFSIVSTLELPGLIAWGVLTGALLICSVACLRGSTAGLIGLVYLVSLALSMGVGMGLFETTGSEVPLIPATALLIFGILAVPTTALWSLVDLFRRPRLRRWQTARYSVKK